VFVIAANFLTGEYIVDNTFRYDLWVIGDDDSDITFQNYGAGTGVLGIPTTPTYTATFTPGCIYVYKDTINTSYYYNRNFFRLDDTQYTSLVAFFGAYYVGEIYLKS